MNIVPLPFLVVPSMNICPLDQYLSVMIFLSLYFVLDMNISALDEYFAFPFWAGPDMII